MKTITKLLTPAEVDEIDEWRKNFDGKVSVENTDRLIATIRGLRQRIEAAPHEAKCATRNPKCKLCGSNALSDGTGGWCCIGKHGPTAQVKFGPCDCWKAMEEPLTEQNGKK